MSGHACVKGIHFAFLSRLFFIRFRNCSDSVVFFVFQIIYLYVSVLNRVFNQIKIKIHIGRFDLQLFNLSQTCKCTTCTCTCSTKKMYQGMGMYVYNLMRVNDCCLTPSEQSL